METRKQVIFDADNANDLCTSTYFYKYDPISSPRGGPDMILSVFRMKFDDKQNEILPRACRLQKSLYKTM